MLTGNGIEYTTQDRKQAPAMIARVRSQTAGVCDVLAFLGEERDGAVARPRRFLMVRYSPSPEPNTWRWPRDAA
jgi:hypothetical protein